MQKKVPVYLLPMIDDYLSNRWVIYEGDKWSLKEEMTCGAPQGSRVGPLVWNVMYDDFLRLELSAGTSIIGFVDDILELRINESLWRAKRWLDSRDLKIAPEKTEASLVTDRGSFQYTRIVLRENEVEWKTNIKYMVVQLYQMWSELGSVHAKHWWIQGSKEKTGGERGALEAALCSSSLGWGWRRKGRRPFSSVRSLPV